MDILALEIRPTINPIDLLNKSTFDRVADSDFTSKKPIALNEFKSATTSEEDEDSEVTHEYFFGENIRRVINAFKNADTDIELSDESTEGKKWAEYLEKLSPEDFGKYKV